MISFVKPVGVVSSFFKQILVNWFNWGTFFSVFFYFGNGFGVFFGIEHPFILGHAA